MTMAHIVPPIVLALSKNPLVDNYQTADAAHHLFRGRTIGRTDARVHDATLL